MKRRRSRQGAGLTPARLVPRDVGRVGSAGLRGRPVRVILSALGIAIGIATMVTVVGISSSSKAELMERLDRLGTGMLTAEPGKDLFGGDAELDRRAAGMAGRVSGVEKSAATGTVPEASVRRSDRIPEADTGGLAVQAASESLLDAIQGRVRDGRWLNAASGRYPAVVLGAVAAERLGITAPGQQVWIKDRYFTVLGVLDPLPLAPEIDRSALIGWPAAERLLGFDGHPTKVYVRAGDEAVQRVSDLLARAIAPGSPEEVAVSRPSDALAARAAASGAFTGLLLGLGAVALLVGGVGVANTMVISVLERRHEVGLRRSLGATRGQIRIQFLTESLLLSGLGGVAGAVMGALVTAGFAMLRGVPFALPPWAVAAGFAATLVIGTVAGIYPAVRASRVSPTVALHTG